MKRRAISYTILGTPVPKHRARAGKGHHYTPDATRHYQAKVKSETADAFFEHGLPPFDGPIWIDLDFVFPRPEAVRLDHRHRSGFSPPMTSRPDLDNLVKVILDALNKTAYRDDALVCELFAHKRFIPTISQDQRAAVRVTIRELPNLEDLEKTQDQAGREANP